MKDDIYLKEKHKYRLKKIRARKQFMTEELDLDAIEKMYKELNLPSEKGIDKKDYLEYFFQYGNNTKLYKALFKTKKNANISWKDFRNIKWKDYDPTIGVLYIDKVNNEINTIKSTMDLYDNR